MHNWASTLRPFGVMCLRRGGSDCPQVGVSEAALTTAFSSVSVLQVHPSGRAVPSSREMELFCKVGV